MSGPAARRAEPLRRLVRRSPFVYSRLSHARLAYWRWSVRRGGTGQRPARIPGEAVWIDPNSITHALATIPFPPPYRDHLSLVRSASSIISSRPKRPTRPSRSGWRGSAPAISSWRRIRPTRVNSAAPTSVRPPRSSCRRSRSGRVCPRWSSWAERATAGLFTCWGVGRRCAHEAPLSTRLRNVPAGGRGGPGPRGGTLSAPLRAHLTL